MADIYRCAQIVGISFAESLHGWVMGDRPGGHPPSTRMIFQTESGGAGIEDNNKSDNKITLYPNPVLDLLSVTIPSTVKGIEGVEISDHMGRCVMRNIHINHTSNGFSLDVSGLRSGLYGLVVKSAQGVAHSAFVKL